MARLRALYIGYTTQGETTTAQHILVLDDLDPDQAQNLHLDELKSDQIPPIVAFPFPVEIPDSDPEQTVTIHVDGAADPDQVAQKVADIISQQERTTRASAAGWTPPYG